MPSDVAPAEVEADMGSAREENRSERTGAIEGIRRGLESAARGEGRPVDEVFAEPRSRYGCRPRHRVPPFLGRCRGRPVFPHVGSRASLGYPDRPAYHVG